MKGLESLEQEQEEQQISIITLVEKQKRGRHRYNIFLNEEYAFQYMKTF